MTMLKPFIPYNPSLSIIFSFRNEEEVLPELLSRVRSVLEKEIAERHLSEYELIFVNDASTDRSEAILRDAAKERDDIKIITMSRRFGVSPCVLAGMEYSVGDLVVYMDADLQDPPEVIPKMLEVWRQRDEVDVVHTQRELRAGESKFKLWITELGYHILHRVSSIDMQIEVGDFKLLSRRAVNHLVQFKEYNPFLRGLVYWIGFTQVTIRYKRDPRFAGDTKFPVLSPKVIRNFLYSALISFSDVPLQLCALVGLIASSLAFMMVIYILFEKIQGHNLPGWTAIMSSTLFLSGIQLLSVGILGLYISAIFVESKRRPNYIVRNTFGFEDSNAEKASQHVVNSNTSHLKE
jgi:glycosyltransferase involved in cell wall biosynthesis